MEHTSGTGGCVKILPVDTVDTVDTVYTATGVASAEAPTRSPTASTEERRSMWSVGDAAASVGSHATHSSGRVDMLRAARTSYSKGDGCHYF